MEYKETSDINSIKGRESACDSEHSKSLYKIKKMVNENIEKKFTKLEDYLKVLRTSKKINSLFIVSKAGYGKTTYVIYFLMKAGLKPNKDFVLINTHTSPLSLYSTLMNNSEKVLIFDDMPKLFRDEMSKNLFLSALWSPTDKRIVNWNSIITMKNMDLPKKFIFNGKVIALLNKIPKDMEAIMSRCMTYEMNIPRKQIIELIQEISKVSNIPEEVVKFIKNNTDLSHELSIRTLIKTFEIYKTSDNWKEIALEQLESSNEIRVIMKYINLSVKEQIQKFAEETGLKRASYYLYRAELRKREKGL